MFYIIFGLFSQYQPVQVFATQHPSIDLMILM